MILVHWVTMGDQIYPPDPPPLYFADILSYSPQVSVCSHVCTLVLTSYPGWKERAWQGYGATLLGKG